MFVVVNCDKLAILILVDKFSTLLWNCLAYPAKTQKQFGSLEDIYLNLKPNKTNWSLINIRLVWYFIYSLAYTNKCSVLFQRIKMS